MSALEFTVFRDLHAQKQWRCTDTPEGIAARLRACSAADKFQLPTIKLATFGAIRSAAGSLRHDANVLTVTGAEGDYDGEQVAFDRACDLMFAADIAGVVYTSGRHTPARPRWRALTPYSQPLPPTRRKVMVARLNGVLGGILGPESFVLSQAFFAGGVTGACDYRVEVIPGDPVDLRDDLDAGAVGPAAAPAKGPAPGADGEALADAELVRTIVSGSHGLHNALVALAARYVGRGTPPASVETTLRGLMDAWPEAQRDARWRKRRAEVPGITESARRKFQADTDNAFRECAKLLMQMHRQRRSAQSMEMAARALMLLHGLPEEAAQRLIEQAAGWCCRTLVANGGRS
jgi:hypothetical protein